MHGPLLALIIFMQNPQSWKDQVYATKYEKVVASTKVAKPTAKPQSGSSLSGDISYYGTGTPGNYTACWNEYKGRTFKVSYNNSSVIVKCNDTGHFKEMGRVLDLGVDAFKQLTSTSAGIIHNAKVELLK